MSEAFELASDARAIADAIDPATVNWHGRAPADVLDAWQENRADMPDLADDLEEMISDGPAAVRDDVEGYAHTWAVNDADDVNIGCGCPLEGSD